MRYLGRVKINKVDHLGRKIKGNLASWKLKNPKKLVFDSKLEWECYTHLKQSINTFEFQPKINLFPSHQTIEFVKGNIKPVTQRSIGYTPDFYLPKYDIYIEVKGYADPLFKLRWKLFKLKNNKGYIVYSLQELKDLLEQLKLLKNDILKN